MPNAQIVAGNWKMNGTIESAMKLARDVVSGASGLPATIVLCPPDIHIPYIVDITKGNAVVIGGQDCSAEDKGAFTGEISAAMLKDLACEFVIVGHSERRQNNGETNELVNKKAQAAIRNGLRPIVCVGETEEERNSGKALEVVEEQIKKSTPDDASVVLAYEPVWAIGTGNTPTEDDIKEMHEHIFNVLGNAFSNLGERTKILYGGSVKAENAKEILETPGVGGVLVGGASLNPDQFLEIIKQAK